MAWSKGQHVPRPGQPAAHRRRRQPRSMPQPLPARGDPNPDHLFVADGGGQCPGRAGGRTRKKEGPMGRLNQLPSSHLRLNQLPSSHSPRGERKLPSRAPLPAAVPVSVLALALTAVTTLVVTGATRAPDARALAAGTALDTPGLAHLVARCIALGGQFGLVGTGLILTAAAVAWHRRVWRPLLVPLAALAALNAAALALKLATGRTAPHAGIDLVFAGGWSYPSGHAVNATVCLPLLVAVGYRNARSGADRREWSPSGPDRALR